MRKIIFIGLALLLMGAGPAHEPISKTRFNIPNDPPIRRRDAAQTLRNVYQAIDKVKNPDEFKLAADIQEAVKLVEQVIWYSDKQIRAMIELINWQKKEIEKFNTQALNLEERINIQNRIIGECGARDKLLEAMKEKP